MRMLTLRRCCLPGGIDRSEGVRNTTISFIENHKIKPMTMTGLGTIIGWRAVLMVHNGVREQWCKRRLCLMLGDTGGGGGLDYDLLLDFCELSTEFCFFNSNFRGRRGTNSTF